jgi:glucosylceramidase
MHWPVSMFGPRRSGGARLFGSLVIVLLGALSASGQVAKVLVSSKAGNRLTPKDLVRFEPQGTIRGHCWHIDEAVTYQKIDGFGASFQEAGAICLNSLGPAEQEKVLEALFDRERGAGFSAMKTVIAATDFMSAGPWYSYNDTPGDVEMKNFSVARDLGPNGLVTYIKRARRYGTFVLQAPMDYPPDWMLTNLEDREKQDVDPKYFDALALYYVRYLQEYEKNGIFINYLSLFNEPDIYTKIPYTKIRDLLKNHVGPLFAKEGVRTQLQPSEAPNRDDAYRNYPIVLDDPEARRYVSCLPYHGYEFKDHAKIVALHERYPDLPLWMTEVDHSYQTDTPRSVPLPKYDWEDGDFWGNQIFSDLESYASAWIYWNMILDEKGGPCLVSEVHENRPGNMQHPVVVIDREKKKVTYTGLYYYLAHFSKFVRPGAVRIGITGTMEGVRCLAFKTPEGGLIAQLLNSRKVDTEVQLESRGRLLRVKLPAVSITTLQWKP